MGAQVGLHKWKGQGIIARFDTRRRWAPFKRLVVPAIDVWGYEGPAVSGGACRRHRHRGAMAAEHLLEAWDPANSEIRRARQRTLVGPIVWTHSPTPSASTDMNATFYRPTNLHEIPEAWDTFIEHAAAWLQAQPKADGPDLCNDGVGPMIPGVADQAGIAVPEEVAIVGVDNDEPICGDLRSAAHQCRSESRRSGYQAPIARSVMMPGRAPPNEPLLLKPRSVVVANPPRSARSKIRSSLWP